MLVFPNAKINIGLQVTEKRPDGFHNIRSVFYPINWRDGLEIIEAKDFKFTQTGIRILSESKNLCERVYDYLIQEFNIPHVHIHLHKMIPIGAGLGGGSSNAAFTVKVLNNLFDLKLTDQKCVDIIKLFGSDCTFFLNNKPLLAINKGDDFEAIDLSLKGKYIVLIYPDLFISTQEAYQFIQPRNPEIDIEVGIRQPISEWKNILHNDFENQLFIKYPILEDIKKQLYDLGAAYASMSGSGSTIYGIFEKDLPETKLFPSNYTLWKGMLD